MGSKTTETGTQLPGFQREALRGLFGRAEEASESVQGQPIHAQRGADQLIADQLTREQAVGNVGAGESSRSLADLFTSQLTGEGGQDLFSGEAGQSAINAAIAPIERNLFESILPQVQSQAIAAGSEGGAREQINLGRAVEQGFVNPALEAASQLSFQDLLSRRAAAPGIASLIPQLMQAGAELNLLPAELLDLVGLRGQEERQDILDAAVQQPFVGLPELAAIIQQSVGGGTTATTSGPLSRAIDTGVSPFGLFG